MERLIQLDREITLAINSLHSPVTDQIWMFFSNKLVWIPLYLAVLVFFFIKLGWKKALLAFGCCVLMVLCCDQFANLIKISVQRIRPCNDEAMLLKGLHVLEEGGGFSFFSAHAANSFGFAACSAGCFRWIKTDRIKTDRIKTNRIKTGRLCTNGTSCAGLEIYTVSIYIWALLVSISRVFVARHFAGDVLVGIIVGIVFGLIISRSAGSLLRISSRRPR